MQFLGDYDMVDIRKNFKFAETLLTAHEYLIVHNIKQVHEIIDVTNFETDLDNIKDKILSKKYTDETLPINVILLRIHSYIEDVEHAVQTKLLSSYLDGELSEVVYNQLSKDFFTLLKTTE